MEKEENKKNDETVSAAPLAEMIRALRLDYEEAVREQGRETAQTPTLWAAIEQGRPSREAIAAAMPLLSAKDQGVWLRALAIKNRAEWIEASLDGGADVDARVAPLSMTPLRYAARWGSLEACVALAKTANRNARDRVGGTPIDGVQMDAAAVELILAVKPDGPLPAERARELLLSPQTSVARLDALKEHVDWFEIEEGLCSLLDVALSGGRQNESGLCVEAFAWLAQELDARDRGETRRLFDLAAPAAVEIVAGELSDLAVSPFDAENDARSLARAELKAEKIEWALEGGWISEDVAQRVGEALEKCRPGLPRATARRESKEIAKSAGEAVTGGSVSSEDAKKAKRRL
jgi:hypothetical protein